LFSLANLNKQCTYIVFILQSQKVQTTVTKGAETNIVLIVLLCPLWSPRYCYSIWIGYQKKLYLGQ